MNPRVIEVKHEEKYRLILKFDNNEWRVFDVAPYLHLGIFQELKSLEMFNSVKIENGTVLWPNEADFCPDTLFLESTLLDKNETN